VAHDIGFSDRDYLPVDCTVNGRQSRAPSRTFGAMSQRSGKYQWFLPCSDLTNPCFVSMKFAMSRKVPKGRLERAARLARMGAGAGLGWLTGKSTEALAEQAALTLSSLRGLAAKVGQMASSVEGVLPESIEGPFVAALSQLRDQTQTSAPSEVTAVVEAELGRPIDESFAVFDVTPIASASIGQVHRAVLFDGREVAVKVQHPGIEQAIGNDLSNVRILERLVGTVVPHGLEPERIFEEVAMRLRDELDYRLEAESLSAFSSLHEGDPHVRIPAVVPSHSARRVLTTEFVRGKKLEQVLADASEDERQQYAETLWRFVFRSVLVGGRFNADPHPGNFLFAESPRIHFLDFGCVQQLSERRRLAARRVHLAAVDRDAAAFSLGVRDLLDSRSGAYEDFSLEFTRRAFEPLFASPFRITSAYLKGLVAFAGEAKVKLLTDRRSAFSFPPELALMNRLQFGFYSLLSKLDVSVDYARIERSLLKGDA
jgi:predicted unusual protein kinase regulating ubiquinone biosynthesis (AarF/ABC1/UbiB family)